MPHRRLDQPASFLSRLPARPIDRRLALAVVAASALVFAVAVPFAKIQLPAVLGFIPTYQSALATNDLMATSSIIFLFAGLAIWLAPKPARVAEASLGH